MIGVGVFLCFVALVMCWTVFRVCQVIEEGTMEKRGGQERNPSAPAPPKATRLPTPPPPPRRIR